MTSITPVYPALAKQRILMVLLHIDLFLDISAVFIIAPSLSTGIGFFSHPGHTYPYKRCPARHQHLSLMAQHRLLLPQIRLPCCCSHLVIDVALESRSHAPVHWGAKIFGHHRLVTCSVSRGTPLIRHETDGEPTFHFSISGNWKHEQCRFGLLWFWISGHRSVQFRRSKAGANACVGVVSSPRVPAYPLLLRQ
ncbi:hypothetical protein BJY52DRAFT_388543 [Lactarius psammicola]|nr:hypothetical protein BJY52DRAFT_388543 [Lactarius psammicola]